MTIEESIQATLAAVGSAYQDIAPQGTVTPYIIWMQIVSTFNKSMQGASNTQNTRIQIDCYAATQAGRSTLAAAVIAAMSNAPFTNVPLSSQNLYESEVKLFRAQLDFSVWSTG